jgi:hypothetical protein
MRRFFTILCSVSVAFIFAGTAMAANLDESHQKLPTKTKQGTKAPKLKRNDTKSTKQSTSQDDKKTTSHFGQKVEKKDDHSKK